jgi:Dolichyl-phosphate-mannose-protein mannosyltransferase
MTQQKVDRLRLVFYLLWIVISLLQAAFTELLDDEAYYWTFSTRLDWGYYDHPPMIAFLIKCGYSIFKNELGVRLIPSLLTVGSIFFIEKLTQPKNLKLFYVIISSIAILQIGGILAIPDTALIFFSVIFFLAFKKYSETDNILHTILLALSISLLLYSKYSGALIIAITLFSDVKIFRRKSLWLAFVISSLLFLPHLFWQIHNNYPSLRYHLIERTSKTYNISHTLNYVFTQPFVFGPFMGLFIIYSLFVFKPSNSFEKIIANNAIGVFLFFLFLTIKGRVEGNWTWIAIFPLIYIGYKQAEVQFKLKKLIYAVFPLTIISILLVRIYLVWDYLPEGMKVNAEFHGNRSWTRQLNQVAGSTPVAFVNSFQRASKYEFYTGNKSFSLNTGLARKNQYSVWNSEYEFQGKKILIVPDIFVKNFSTIETSKGTLNYSFIDNFSSFGNIKIAASKDRIKIRNDQAIHLKVRLQYLDNKLSQFYSDNDYPPHLGYLIYQGDKKIAEKKTEVIITNEMIQNAREYEVTVQPPVIAGEYKIYLAIIAGWLPPPINGSRIKLIVTK